MIEKLYINNLCYICRILKEINDITFPSRNPNTQEWYSSKKFADYFSDHFSDQVKIEDTTLIIDGSKVSGSMQKKVVTLNGKKYKFFVDSNGRLIVDNNTRTHAPIVSIQYYEYMK